jgi:N6-L-threonylcarbamoyladenine synthase
LAYSQIDDHQQYWWVVPEIASRLHSEKIIKVLANIWFANIAKVDFISVTVHPWLPGSLVVGKAVAHLLWEHFKKPVVEVNHIHWHIFSLLAERDIRKVKFPMMVLTASWWHNDLYLVSKTDIKNNIGNIKFEITKIWNTLDDAAWECFDKVSRMLWWPYPWWVWIWQKALKWKPNPDFVFKRIFLSAAKFEFSFSGMKSQASFLLNKLEKNWIKLTEEMVHDIAYEFQEAVIEVLAKKLIKSWAKHHVETLGIAGGVSCSDRLREYLNTEAKKHWVKETLKPTIKMYSTDNAAMIWVAWILKKLGMLDS